MWEVVLILVLCFSFAASQQQDISIYENTMNSTTCDVFTSPHKHFAISKDAAWKPWDDYLYALYAQYLHTYLSTFPVVPPISSDTGYILCKHNDSKAMNPSISPDPQMVITGIILLNSDVGGGDIWFPRQKKKIEPACGKMILFPNSYTHPISMEPVRIGNLRFIVTWFKTNTGIEPVATE